MWIVILIVLIVGLAAVLLKVAAPRRPAPQPEPALPAAPAEDPQTEQDPPDETVTFSNEEIEQAVQQVFRLSFGVARFDYQISGEHAAVLESVGKALDQSVHERDYFPRRPLLLPKLLQAINDNESSRQELVRLIMEDPALAGSVLQRANSAYHRTTPSPVENLDRAVFLLGTDGLRGLLAEAIMQPVFRIPPGCFEDFAKITWEQAERTSSAAEACAKVNGDVEPIVARLLGLVSLLANIVLFRLTLDKYRDHPGVLVRAEVFIQAIRQHRACTASLIAQAWQLSNTSIAAFTEQQQQLSPQQMSSLGRCVYFGDLCGNLSLLSSRGTYSQNLAVALLMGQGADRECARSMYLSALGYKRE